jgi:carbon monoxide dehydrogenase subunit G
VQIQNRFEVPMAPAQAWAFLMNLPSTVPCFPGAELTDQLDADNYKGRVMVKLGPVLMVFNGKLQVEERDQSGCSGRVKATWSESKGRGNAVTVTWFAMKPLGEGTEVEVKTDVQLAGQVAQYGRGAGVITEISEQLVSDFADNLRAAIQARGLAPPDEPDPVPDASYRPPSQISGFKILGRAIMNRIKGRSE